MDGKTLGKASRVLCTNFHHMGKYHSQQMKAMWECQLAGIHELKTQVIQALWDGRVDLSSRQHLLGTVQQCGGRLENQNLLNGQQGEASRGGLHREQEGDSQSSLKNEERNIGQVGDIIRLGH